MHLITLLFAATSGYLALATGDVQVNGNKVHGLTRLEVGSTVSLKANGSAIYVSKRDMTRFLLSPPFLGKAVPGGLKVIGGKMKKLDELAAGSAGLGAGFGSAAGQIVRGDGDNKFKWLWPVGTSRLKDMTIQWKGIFAAEGFRVRVSEEPDGEEVWSAKTNGSSRRATCPAEDLKEGRSYRIQVEALAGGEPVADVERDVVVASTDLDEFVSKVLRSGLGALEQSDLLETLDFWGEAATVISSGPSPNSKVLIGTYTVGDVK